MRRLWAVPVDGDAVGASLFVTRGGRVIASTNRQTVIHRGETFHEMHLHAHRCCAIEEDGSPAWTTEDVHAKCEGPDGSIIATNDRHDVVVLDRGGKVLDIRSADKPWRVDGWDGGRPIIAPLSRATSVDGVRDEYTNGELRRYDERDALVSSVPIDTQRFAELRAEARKRGAMIPTPGEMVLDWQPSRGRFIAHHRSLGAWLMSLGIDGSIDWLQLLSPECCNSVAFIGDDMMTHVSGCGRQLAFVTTDGEIVARHSMMVGACVYDGVDLVCVSTRDAVRGFDRRGEPRWSHELPGVVGVAVHGDRLYAIAGHELVAFAIA